MELDVILRAATRCVQRMASAKTEDEAGEWAGHLTVLLDGLKRGQTS